MTTVVLVADGPAMAHLARALAAHARWCRTNRVPFPADLAHLRDILTASDSQQTTSRDDDSDPLLDAAMQRDALTYRDVADRLAVSERTVQRMTSAGDLPAVDIAGCKRIRTSDLAAYLDGLRPEEGRDDD